MLNKIKNIIMKPVVKVCEYIVKRDILKNGGFILNQDDKALHEVGVVIAGMTICQIDNMYYPNIMVDDLYYRLTEQTQRFILLHELGHYNLQFDELIAADCEGLYRYDELEFEADGYAADILGKEATMNALKEMKELFIEMGGIGCIDELDRRIMNIKYRNVLMVTPQYN